MALRKFRIVGGRDQNDPKSLAEARRRARPLLRYWLRKVERAVVDGRLLPIDYLLAKELTNYPSSNQGRCYAGQKRLGRAVGRCARTARQSLKRLCTNGLLLSKRGGPGRTASWSFCFERTPIFGGDPKDAAPAPKPTGVPSPPVGSTATSALDRQPVAGLDRQPVAAKPSEPDPNIERNPSPLAPTTAGECCTSVGRPSEVSKPLDGEILSDVISFQEFWIAAGRSGHEGFARGEWRKLSTSDKAVISDRLQRGGRLDLHRLWAGTWLRDRVWEESPIEPETCFDFAPRPVPQYAKPGSDIWRAERERLRAAGYSFLVKFMDHQASQGKGWNVQCRSETPQN